MTVVDPAAGSYRLSWEAVNELYSGVAILLEPAEAFEPGGRAAAAPASRHRPAAIGTSGTSVIRQSGTSVINPSDVWYAGDQPVGRLACVAPATPSSSHVGGGLAFAFGAIPTAHG